MQQQKNTPPSIEEQNTSDLMDYLRYMLDDICEKIAEKFNLYDSERRPRKAFIVDVLSRYTCPCCAFRALTQMREQVEVDAIFRENHDLAVSMLVHTLRGMSQKDEYQIIVKEEARSEYGRLDVLIKRLNGGLLLVASGASEVIVEIKTNMGFSLKQILRYLLQRPDATAVIWRVRKRQTLVIDGRKHRWLIALFANAIIQQGLTILNGKFEECEHHPRKNSPYEIKNPQETLDDFLTCLVEGLAQVAEIVLSILNGKQPN
ncbi:hypothetical protein H5T51_00680 [Candidatus Bathyarchaeota archaeon]|nr:hypothetical protein [Candidatus Bathyarchaeota archaeon]